LTWAEAVAEQNARGWPALLLECDSYNYVDDGFSCGDSTSVYFAYDKATGDRIAAVELSLTDHSQICLGGPATVSRLGSCSAVFNCIPNDAGPPKGNCDRDSGAPSGALVADNPTG
jgi:hypothetical protein